MNGHTGLSSCVGSSDGARSTVVRLLCFLPRGVVSLPCPNLSSLQTHRGIAGGVPRHARGPTRLGALVRQRWPACVFCSRGCDARGRDGVLDPRLSLR
ncbi:hypothetical protein S83_032119 [Arachis hypogaea]